MEILKYTAIGDAIGADFEFTNETITSFDDLKGYKRGIGRYTDDTQMSIAVALQLCSKSPILTTVDFANAFLAIYRNDPRKGYARNFQKLLEAFKGDGHELIQTIEKFGKSNKNGGAMRAAVCGCADDFINAGNIAIVQAMATHDIEGQRAAEIIGKTSFLLRTLGRSHAESFFQNHAALTHYNTELPPCSTNGLETVSITLNLFFRYTSLKELVVAAINTKGDVDSVLAIAFALASWPMSGYVYDLPKWCYNHLEKNKIMLNMVDKHVAKQLRIH